LFYLLLAVVVFVVVFVVVRRGGVVGVDSMHEVNLYLRFIC
jgi:hypothetical protein